MAISAGSRLGPYEILSPLGSGGMGEVWRARDPRLGREVAIKVLPEELSSDRDRLKRFEREARAASALNHPNIVTIHEIGEADGRAFLVMERIEGQTLRELILEDPLPPRRLLSIATQIADGLARAHETGIVHRDLKPENVMVTKDGFVKILDFGLAKVEPSGATPASPTEAQTVSTGTEAGTVLGTVGYMSPEQASGKPLDYRSDQFSLGVILYRARLYIQDVGGGGPKPITPEGTGATFRGNVVSPDGKFVTGSGPAQGFSLYPVEGGSPIPIPGLEEGEAPIQWVADGRSIYVHRPAQSPARVFRLDVSSGRRTLWRELSPFDPAGTSGILNIAITPDGKSYAYDYGQVLSDLYLVEGLK